MPRLVRIQGGFYTSNFSGTKGTLAAKTAHWALNYLLSRVFQADNRDNSGRPLPLLRRRL
jgi:hypothetical protein